MIWTYQATIQLDFNAKAGLSLRRTDKSSRALAVPMVSKEYDRRGHQYLKRLNVEAIEPFECHA